MKTESKVVKKTFAVRLGTAAWRGSPGSRIVRILFAATCIGMMLAGLYPADVNENMHVLGAFLIFFLGNAGLLLAGLNKGTEHPMLVRVLAPALGLLGLSTGVLHLSGLYFGLGMGGMERVAVFPIQIWMLVMGVVLALRRVRPVSG